MNAITLCSTGNPRSKQALLANNFLAGLSIPVDLICSFLYLQHSLCKNIQDKILETILPTCLHVCFICTVHISTHMFFYLYIIRIQAHFHSSQGSNFLSGLYCQIKFEFAVWNWKTERTKCALNCFNVKIQLDTRSTGTYQVFTEKLVAPPPSQNLTSVLRKCLHVC